MDKLLKGDRVHKIPEALISLFLRFEGRDLHDALQFFKNRIPVRGDHKGRDHRPIRLKQRTRVQVES